MPRFNPALLKNAMPYTVEDLSRIFDVSEPSIRRLLKKHPSTMIDGSPHIVIGRALKRALKANQKPRNRGASGDASFFCGSCKAKVRPAEQVVEAQPHCPGVTARLSAMCEHCEGSVSKFVSLKDRGAFEASLGEATIGEWGD